MKLTESIIKSEYKFKGNILNLRFDEVELPDGKTSTREIVEHPGGVCILAITDKNEIVMVRQYRAGAKQITLEIPAGKLEWGEEPYECGLRELREETGYIANEYFMALDYFSTPGFAEEKLYMYVAKGLTPDKTNPDDDEFVETQLIPIETLKKMVLNNEIKDAKTIIAVLLADRYKN